MLVIALCTKAEVQNTIPHLDIILKIAYHSCSDLSGLTPLVRVAAAA
jgi:hypothetical protein